MFDSKNINKLYRYEALLQAIDFFTQKFNLNQLSSYAFEFANEILTLNSSALFIKEGNSFNLMRTRNYAIPHFSVSNSVKLQRIATFHGDIMTSHYNSYFEDDIIDAFKPKMIIPLIIQDLLYGFVLSDGKAVDAFDEDDFIISRALMKLINNALENSKNYADLQETNKYLDQKIFNLFSINQSSRALLSELSLKNLYALSIDIFSELTSSKITTFGLYDEIRDRIIIRGYKNVFSSNTLYMEFELCSNCYTDYRLVFNYKKDADLLRQLFVNYEDFEKVEAEYIILIVKDKILGFVTISRPVNDRAYDDSLFELIESLAASTYISFSNAILFEEVEHQKQLAEQKFKVLSKLNSLIKNINSCTDIDELCNVTIKTLSFGFGIKKAFIALHENEDYIIKNVLGFKPSSSLLMINEMWQQLSKAEITVKYTVEDFSHYFDPVFTEAIGPSNCLVICPISLDRLEIGFEETSLGYIVVLETPELLKEEEVLLIDTVANSIAPILKNMKALENIKKEYVLNYYDAFTKGFKIKVEDAERFFIPFSVYFKRMAKQPFVPLDLSFYADFENYYFDNMLFVLSSDTLPMELFDGIFETNSLEELQNHVQSFYASKN